MKGSLEKRFHKILGGRNFMTPNIMGYYESKTNGYISELSNGVWMEDGKLYGIVVVDTIEEVHVEKLDKVFHDMDEAIEYIRSLSQTK